MGKYRTSSQKIKCGDCVGGLLFWGIFFFVSPPFSLAATVVDPSSLVAQGHLTKAATNPGLAAQEPLTTVVDPRLVAQGHLTTAVDPVAQGQLTSSADPFLVAQPTTGKLRGDILLAEPNCTPSALNDFPGDFLTKEQRLHGGLIFHFLISFYAFYALFIVCDDYFVPSIEAITRDLGISTDLAGATFMAISTSAPELFTNVIGTFVTKGDMGVGTIVGSAIFNILAVGCCCGLGAGYAVQNHRKQRRPGIALEWYPLTRDCVFYLCAVGLLLLVLANRRVYWYEALTLLLFYLVYILVMCNNALFKSWAEGIVSRFQNKDTTKEKRRHSIAHALTSEEKAPLKQNSPTLKSYVEIVPYVPEIWDPEGSLGSSSSETSTEEEGVLLAKALLRQESRCQDEKEGWGLFTFPFGSGCGTWMAWFLSWPIRFFLTLTIPDCREPRWRRWYVMTLIMCIIWIATMTYLVSWMMEIIGDTIDIPESVTGLTFLAAGTSIPEVISSVIVARQGFGSMGLSNSIGSNTFDLLFCLGLPWFIEALLLRNSEVPYVEIHSGGIEYSVGLLISSLILFYLAVALNGFVLDWKVGVTCLVMYAIFIPVACLLELNFFFPVNLPTCPH